MTRLTGRVAVVTGAGRGLGREYALLLARQGARVIVNDVGADLSGRGLDASPAEAVVAEITAAGGQAVAVAEDVSNWAGARRIVQAALDRFGDLHVVVNNAGNMRNAPLTEMSEEDWKAVVGVHLNGHFAVTRFAAEFWKQQAEAGIRVDRSLINTFSRTACYPNADKVNYVAAKGGIAAMTLVADLELADYGVRCNAIAPGAMTRMAASLPAAGGAETTQFPASNPLHPSNVAPFVGYLARETCPIRGRLFYVCGESIQLFAPWSFAHEIRTEGPWTLQKLEQQGPELADFPLKALPRLS